MKMKRQAKIRELVQTENIETQEDLARRLAEEGFEVTQSTISRDIHELSLMKTTTPQGRQKYSMLASVISQFSKRLLTIFRQNAMSFKNNQTMVIVKTYEGMAMAVAACIDAMNLSEILGCIAGDDTIFCAVKDADAAESIVEQFNNILNADSDEEE